MRKFSFSILLIALIICFSCEEKGWFIRCQDCLSGEPLTANLNIKLSNPTSAIKVSIFEGVLDDSVLYHTDIVTWTEYSFEVPLNKTYTVTATYELDGKTYTAVDSATPRVRYAEDQCKDPCYYIYDNNLNLRIKYTE
jgi:hypothetical protein